jgi:ligand-binding sensor domain-containing protein/two-component sensor histidine kinase
MTTLKVFFSALCIAFFSLIPRNGLSQPADLQFEHLTVSDGLSQDIVTSLHRDRFGFLWIGTEDGLNRYDGYSIASYKHNPRDSNSLPENGIRGICDYGDEDMLVAHARGFSIYNRATDMFRTPPAKIQPYSTRESRNPVRDKKGRYWIIMEGKRILWYDPHTDSVQVYEIHPPGTDLSSDPLRDLVIDTQDSLWVISEQGIAVFEEGSNNFRVFKTPHERLDVVNWSAIRDSSGDFWITTNGGLYKFDRRKKTTSFVPLGFTMDGTTHRFDQLIGGLCWDRQGRLWIGGFNGLYCFNTTKGTTTRYCHAPDNPMSLQSNRIYTVMLDPSNVLWAGTWRGGLSKTDLKKERFGHYRHSEITPFAGASNDIIGIVEQPGGTFWFASVSGGLTNIHFDSGVYRRFPNDQRERLKFISGDITSMTGGAGDDLWIAMGSKLTRFDPKKQTYTTISPPAIQDRHLQIQYIYHDHLGYLWMGVHGFGIIRYDSRISTFAYFRFERNDSSAQRISGAWMFFEDRQGTLWAGGWGGNSTFYRFDRTENRFVGIPRHEILNARTAIEDSNGNLWIGTWGLGMSRYSPLTGEVRQFLEQDGLPSNYVKGILSDKSGNLWISTENGISKFSLSAQTFRNYSVSDGLQGNFFYTGSCLKGSDGRFYFGGPNGVNAFYPDSIREESYSVPVLLTDFRVFDRRRTFGQHLSLTGEIGLTYEEDMFSFEYVSLDFSAPIRNRYAYKLEGYDNDWIQAGSRRFASYTHLDPGQYHFTVRGTNSDGVWSPQVASIGLTITPAFWQTWWFRMTLICAMLTLLYAFYRYRLHKLLEIERTRSAIATDLHDDIGTSLTNIALFSDLARRDLTCGSPEVTTRLENISQTSRSLLDSMNDIVWSIKPENDALEQTILRMEDYAVEILEENGIDLQVQIPEELKRLKLPMALRRNLFLMFKEAIGNVLKHARATRVDVVLSAAASGRRGSMFLLSISDNGIGFPVAERTRGNGLGNMERRARYLHGSISVVSAEGGGTKIEIRFPIKSPR